MGFEIKYIFHPKNEEGSGYQTDSTEEKTIKVGKPFDDTKLDKCAAAIMAQLARRDIWVVDVEVSELVKKSVSFKESKDGKGIVLKNKRFSLNSTAEMVEELEAVDIQPVARPPVTPVYKQDTTPVHPHESIAVPVTNDSVEDLYDNPNAASVKRTIDPRTIDKSKTLYQVYFEPELQYVNQAKQLNLKFSENVKYSVHKTISGAMGMDKIALTDDSGQMVIIEEKFFVRAGAGLMGDRELNFSGNNGEKSREPQLSYGDEIPSEMLGVPDLRG